MTELAARHGLRMFCPPPRLCVDNGIMVAWTGVERLKMGLWEAPPTDLSKVPLFVEVRPRWPLGPRDPRCRPKPQGNKKRQTGARQQVEESNLQAKRRRGTE